MTDHLNRASSGPRSSERSLRRAPDNQIATLKHPIGLTCALLAITANATSISG